MNAAKKSIQEERYGETRNQKFSGKIVVVILAVMLAAALTYAVTQFMRNSEADVTAQESGGEIVSDERMTMSIDVTRKDPSKPAYCIVTALDYDKNEVGRREFVVPRGGEEVERFLVDIPTRERGYAATAYGCSATLPPHLDPRD
ncbi:MULTISPECIES: DUF4307 domain-containing protein [Corynebacterium]|uniref:DUF4307 domain-containing protein n=1 Tax=Corynebacterium evansiae TaxID=2913499 RepID=A0A9X3RGB1_9CORY|nr:MULTISPECIES: DUF4307 domain-containing protein [Corynebacterium]MCG7267733.1 DUF4307 domain-containing protein [Corynebacterium sp. ACRQJ]MCZ9289506.1 DUF4307 domain-containing protein [Corynebacterium evansiae]